MRYIYIYKKRRKCAGDADASERKGGRETMRQPTHTCVCMCVCCLMSVYLCVCVCWLRSVRNNAPADAGRRPKPRRSADKTEPTNIFFSSFFSIYVFCTARDSAGRRGARTGDHAREQRVLATEHAQRRAFGYVYRLANVCRSCRLQDPQCTTESSLD